MADEKISASPAASALSGTELISGVQSGDNVKITPNQVKDLTFSGISGLSAASALSGTEVLPGIQTTAKKITADQIKDRAYAAISSLSAAAALDGTELFVALQSGSAVKVTSAQLNTAIAASVYMSGNQSISGTDEILNFDSEYLDTHNCFDTATHIFTAPIAGKYAVTATFRLTTGSYMSVGVVNAGAMATQAATTVDTFLTIAGIVDLGIGGTIYATATLTAYAAGIDSGLMTIHYIGA